jgi:hypothetical protein
VRADAPRESISALLSRLPARDKDRAAQELAALLLNASEKDHPPKSVTVEQFAKSLVAGFSGKSSSTPVAARIEKSILEVLHSAGTSTSGFKATLRDFERALRDGKVTPVHQKELADLLEALGREVRGPEDTPFL